MNGHVQLATQRPQGLIPSLSAEGRRRDVLIAREESEGLIVGVGVRSEKECYVNGLTNPQCVGYLSALRLREGYRRGLLLGRGYQALHHLHEKGKAPYYLTTVLNSNTATTELLTSGRAGLPVYQDWGEIRTLLIDPHTARSSQSLGNLSISQMRRSEIAEVLEFLKKHGPCRQFFPCYRSEDFGSKEGLLPGLDMDDILLARDERGLVGCVGVWDQSQFKAWKVAGYGYTLTRLRPILNLWARFKKLPSWPEPGESLNIRFLSLFCVRDDDATRAYELLQAALRLANERGASIVVWSLHEDDVFQFLATQVLGTVLKSRLFVVHWPQDREKIELPRRSMTPYLETGSL